MSRREEELLRDPQAASRVTRWTVDEMATRDMFAAHACSNTALSTAVGTSGHAGNDFDWDLFADYAFRAAEAMMRRRQVAP